MRTLTPVSTAIALTMLLAGCGASPVAPAHVVRTAQVVEAADSGKLVFNKKIVYSTIDILGVGPVYQGKLAQAGLRTINALLVAGSKPSDRARLAKATGISPKLLLTWINHGDLMRVTGAGPEYARLLERAGVDTVMELAQRKPAHLAEALKQANDLGGGKQAVHRLPGEVTTSQWVANAKSFVRLINY